MQFIVQFMHTLFVYDEELRWGIQGYSLCLFDNELKGCKSGRLGVKVRTHILCKSFSRNWKWASIIPIASDRSCSDNHGMIDKVIN